MSKYLAHNPDLLNSLQGSPLRMAALGRNMKVIEVLMENTALDVNQRGEPGFVYFVQLYQV